MPDPLPPLTIRSLLSDLGNAVYAVACPVLEAIEHGRHVGNGHHVAQEIVGAFERYVADRPALYVTAEGRPPGVPTTPADRDTPPLFSPHRHMAVCRACGRAREGTLGFAMKHYRECWHARAHAALVDLGADPYAAAEAVLALKEPTP